MASENKILINVSSSKKLINTLIYGNFVEHLGDCIHNGLWAYDPVNVALVKNDPLMERVREDVLKACTELRIPVLRFPGGCYSDCKAHHWKWGIGARESRKKVKNYAWAKWFIKLFFKGAGPKIENQFGTDEFLHFCEKIGSEPYLNVNYGSGTPEEAAQWVEYCNGSIDTEYGALRAKNGREKPYEVKYWGIANEIFGFWETGYEKHPEDYAKKYLVFAKAMREKDPNIKLMACGCFKPGWNQTLLKLLTEKWIDYLTIHRYLPGGLLSSLIGKKHPHKIKTYSALMGSSLIYMKDILNVWEDITTVFGEKTRVKIAFDEWGIWYKFKDVVRTNYNLQDGIWTAMMLLMFQKMSDKCTMANWAQLINTIGTMQSDSNGLILTPVYLAFSLLTNHAHEYLIESTFVDCDSFNSQKYVHIASAREVPIIDCNAMINKDQDKLSIIIVNKHFTDDVPIQLDIREFIPKEDGLLIELNSNSPFDYNTKENRTKIKLMEKPLNGIKPKMHLTIPAHSVSLLKLAKK